MTDQLDNEGYSIRFGGHLWRVEASTFNGQPRISIWPFYAAHDGSMRAGRGGLQIPLDEAEAFVEAILAAIRRLR
jgi:hypothetical protein